MTSTFEAMGTALGEDLANWETCSLGGTSTLRASPPGTPSCPGERPRSKRSSQKGTGCPTTVQGSAFPTLPLRADVLLCNTLFEELDNALSADFLQQYTGNDQLEKVDFLELQVDAISGNQGVEGLGEMLPNLRQLRLNQSAIPSLRDLGTGLSRLRVLWLCRSSLQDLGGITAMPVLEELYISFNDVQELGPLCTHESLQVLDLEGNQVEDLEEIESLQGIPTLRELTFSSNPVCKSEAFSRAHVLCALPQLEVLDDIPRGFQIGSSDLAVVGCDEDAASLANLDADDLELTAMREEISRLSQDCEPLESHSMKELRQRAGSAQDAGMGSAQSVAGSGGEASPEEAQSAAPSKAVSELHKTWAKLRVDGASDQSTNDKCCGDEPTEQDLIVEGLKRSARRPVPHLWSLKSMSARPAEHQRPFTGFSPDRRGLRTAWSSAGSSMSTSYRPTSASGASISGLSGHTSTGSYAASAVPEDLADGPGSDLTAGDDGAVLAGNALAAVRRRRRVAAARGEDDRGIREMLRRFETYTQESCIPEAELELRRRQSESTRPGTSDVRISAPRLLTSGSRPAPADGAPPDVPMWATPGKRPHSRRGSDDAIARESMPKPTFSTEVGEALIID